MWAHARPRPADHVIDAHARHERDQHLYRRAADPLALSALPQKVRACIESRSPAPPPLIPARLHIYSERCTSVSWLIRRSLYGLRLGDDGQLETVGGLPPETGRAALAVARAISDDEFRVGAELWRLYASPDPRAFDEVRRRGSPVFPELHESADLHGAWFPRLGGGRIRLSGHDDLLLGGLTDRWLTPGRLAVEITEERMMWPFHGFAHVRRLREWAAHGAVACEVRDPDNDNPFEQDAFRLTDRTRALLADGLESVGDAPPIYVGGCRINDPASPWVRVADDAGWLLALMPHT